MNKTSECRLIDFIIGIKNTIQYPLKIDFKEGIKTGAFKGSIFLCVALYTCILTI